MILTRPLRCGFPACTSDGWTDRPSDRDARQHLEIVFGGFFIRFFFCNPKYVIHSLQKLKYQGDRSTKELVKFAMSHVHVSVAELWQGNFEEETQAPNRMGKPWLLSVHKDDGSGKHLERFVTAINVGWFAFLSICMFVYNGSFKKKCDIFYSWTDSLDQKASLKVAGVVGEIVNVGVIDCEVQVRKWHVSFFKSHKCYINGYRSAWLHISQSTLSPTFTRLYTVS